MQQSEKGHFDHRAFLTKYDGGTISKFADGQIVFAQGDVIEALYYIVSGAVKVTVNSAFGKEAVIAILEAGDFFGEGCIDGHLLQGSTVTTTSACEIVRIERAAVNRALGSDPSFSNLFLNFVLGRNEKLKDDLIDQLFNSSEKRLARILLTLANSGLGEKSNFITIPINQETLAHMVGTTRSRINQFMNKFRKMGYIEYNGNIKVNNSLLNLILHDQSSSRPAQDSQQQRRAGIQKLVE
jgi:CRP/FNR family transcriptional regulator, cyclic AMP receptor protein